MYLGFDTDDLNRAKAALLLYAMYRSRDDKSALNGLETWSRFAQFTKGAALKSNTTAEFCDQFCKMAKVPCIKPGYLKTGFVEMPDGTLVTSDNVKDYKLKIIEDNTIMTLFSRESQMLVMLVRERIQREKMAASEINESEENEND